MYKLVYIFHYMPLQQNSHVKESYGIDYLIIISFCLI